MQSLKILRSSIRSQLGVLKAPSRTTLFQENQLLVPFPTPTETVSTRSFGTLRSFTPVISNSSGTVGCYPDQQQPLASRLLAPGLSPLSLQSRGLKIVGKVKRRCKDCFLMYINGVKYNLCETHQRHKQMLKQPYWVNQRILTHATNKPKRDW